MTSGGRGRMVTPSPSTADAAYVKRNGEAIEDSGTGGKGGENGAGDTACQSRTAAEQTRSPRSHQPAKVESEAGDSVVKENPKAAASTTKKTRATNQADDTEKAEKKWSDKAVDKAERKEICKASDHDTTKDEGEAGAGTAESSSSEERGRNTVRTAMRRASQEQLRGTRLERRCRARARAAPLLAAQAAERTRERESELARMRAEERASVLSRLAAESAAREEACRRERRRVRNRESVEKSRTRDLVAERQVGSEGDVLAWENERMALFLEWAARGVMKGVRKEVAEFREKRKTARK